MARRQILSLSERESLLALPDDELTLTRIGVLRQNGCMKRRGHAVLADKAYSGHALRNELKNKGIKIVIPCIFWRS